MSVLVLPSASLNYTQQESASIERANTRNPAPSRKGKHSSTSGSHPLEPKNRRRIHTNTSRRLGDVRDMKEL